MIELTKEQLDTFLSGETPKRVGSYDSKLRQLISKLNHHSVGEVDVCKIEIEAKEVLSKIPSIYTLLKMWNTYHFYGKYKEYVEKRIFSLASDINDFYKLAGMLGFSESDSVPEVILSARMAQILPLRLKQTFSFKELSSMLSETIGGSKAEELIKLRINEIITNVDDLAVLAEMHDYYAYDIYTSVLIEEHMEKVYVMQLASTNTLPLPDWIVINIIGSKKYPFLDRDSLRDKLKLF